MLCDCEIKEKGVAIVVYFKMAPQRQSSERICSFSCEHKVIEVANIIVVSYTTVYAIKKGMEDGEGVNRCAGSGRKTVVYHDSCEMSFEAVSGRPCGNMQGDLELKRRLCDELSLILEPSPCHCGNTPSGSRQVPAPSAFCIKCPFLK